MSDPKNDQVISIDVEDDSVIPYPKPEGSQPGVSEFPGMLLRRLSKGSQLLQYPLPSLMIEAPEILSCSLGN